MQESTPEDKLRLVLASYDCQDLTRFCREQGVEKAHLHQLRQELEPAALAMWRERRTGTLGLDLLQEARRRNEELEHQSRRWKEQAQMADLLFQVADRSTVDSL